MFENLILRNCEIVDMYATGDYTMKQLGKKYNLSRERVRQIIVKISSQEMINIVKEQKYERAGLKMSSQAKKYDRIRLKRYLKNLESQGLIWNWNWLCCWECGTTEGQHGGKGLCKNCYSKNLYKRNENYRESAKRSTYNWMKNNPDKVRIMTLKAVKKYNKKNRDRLNEKARERYKVLYSKDPIYREKQLIYSRINYLKNKPNNWRNRWKIRKLRKRLKRLKK